MLFRNRLYEEFGSWPLAYIPYGGPDFGEVRAVGVAVGDGDDSAYYRAFVAAGDRLAGEADAALSRGHAASGRALLLKAAALYAASFHPLYGAPTDPRIIAVYGKQKAALAGALALGPRPATALEIPFEGGSMPGWFIPAEAAGDARGPLIVFTNGYDGTLVDMYFASAVAASRRGYHCVIFDGPGQGGMLYERGAPLRPDWETVIGAVIDFAQTLPQVDAERIALSGWSLGGHLAPRAASAEPRIAALIADPGTWGIADGFRAMAMRMFGLPAAAVADLGQIDEALLRKVEAVIRAEPGLNWKVVKRGFWVHGVDNLRDYFASSERFTMDGRAALIRCPALLTAAENDMLSAGVDRFFEALTCDRTLLRFTAAEGANGHCEMGNRSLLNGRVLDWLDEQFEMKG